MLIYHPNVKETATNKPNAVTAFTVNVSQIYADGTRSIANAYAVSQKLPYFADDGAGLWESGEGTFTAGVLSRDTVNSSSNSGAAVDFSAGGDVVIFVEWSADKAKKTQVLISNLAKFDKPYRYVRRASVTSLIFSAGSAVVQDKLLSWNEITWSGTTGVAPLTAVGLVHWYLYDNSGIATIEASTTQPVIDESLGYSIKTGDLTRRWLFTAHVYSGGSGFKIVPFEASCFNNCVEVMYEGEYIDATNNFKIQAGDSNIATALDTARLATSLTCSFIPNNATDSFVSAKAVFSAANEEIIIGLSAKDNSVDAIDISYAANVYRAQSSKSGKVFFGGSYLKLDKTNINNRNIFLVTHDVAGAPVCDMVNNGYKAQL